MRTFTTAARVGVFVATTAAAAVAIVYFIAGEGWSGESYTVYAVFTDAMGLAERSDVQSSGVRVGSIERVSVEQGRARIDLRVDADFPLYVDAAISKTSSGMMGEYVLNVAPGTEGRQRLKDGDRILFVLEASAMDQVMNDLGQISKDLKSVSRALSETFGSRVGKGSNKDTLRQVADATEALNKAVQENRASIHTVLTKLETMSIHGREKVRRTLYKVRESTHELRRLLAASEDSPDRAEGEIRRILERVDRASASLESSLAQADIATGRVAQGEGTLGRIVEDDALATKLEGAATGMSDYLSGLSRLQAIINLRGDYLFVNRAVKTYLQLRLQPREDKYYALEVVFDPRGRSLTQQTAVDTTNPNDPPTFFELRTTTTNAARFSLQFAQRFGPFWGRFGIKESTGGIGLDTVLLDDRLEISQDLYGFGERVLPRWRLSLGYEFLHRLWMVAGADDVLSYSRRDYFVGGQLRLVDQDLKNILPFAP
ncbi:MAG TPA: MlaD family protein [Polyangiaceae bacterium]|nr:MlaD family protein [Polyangiaceae bacterium]